MKHLLFLLAICFIHTGIAGLTDPTAPPGAKNASTHFTIATLTLNAVFTLPSGNVATINGISVKEGDKLSDLEVLTITSEAVTVKNDLGEERELRLFQPLWNQAN